MIVLSTFKIQYPKIPKNLIAANFNSQESHYSNVMIRNCSMIDEEMDKICFDQTCGIQCLLSTVIFLCFTVSKAQFDAVILA
ncbi:hypothetical protein NLX69_19755 [Rossellomorea sp. BNER]|jgi:hypothetical protein|nr:hypothetical protein [Rossellomorea sp. BNER]